MLYPILLRPFTTEHTTAISQSLNLQIPKSPNSNVSLPSPPASVRARRTPSPPPASPPHALPRSNAHGRISPPSRTPGCRISPRRRSAPPASPAAARRGQAPLSPTNPKSRWPTFLNARPFRSHTEAHRRCFGDAVAFLRSLCCPFDAARIGVGGLQGCIQVFGVFRPKQVVSAGAQTDPRACAFRPSSCPHRASPMRTASVNQTPAAPYHTPIRADLLTPNTIPFRERAILYQTHSIDTPIAIAELKMVESNRIVEPIEIGRPVLADEHQFHRIPRRPSKRSPDFARKPQDHRVDASS